MQVKFYHSRSKKKIRWGGQIHIHFLLSREETYAWHLSFFLDDQWAHNLMSKKLSKWIYSQVSYIDHISHIYEHLRKESGLALDSSSLRQLKIEDELDSSANYTYRGMCCGNIPKWYFQISILVIIRWLTCVMRSLSLNLTYCSLLFHLSHLKSKRWNFIFNAGFDFLRYAYLLCVCASEHLIETSESHETCTEYYNSHKRPCLKMKNCVTWSSPSRKSTTSNNLHDAISF